MGNSSTRETPSSPPLSAPPGSLPAFREKLARAGIRCTRQREAIYSEILASRAHPDAEAVFAGLKPRLPSLSLDTVYRTLWTFRDLALIESVGPRRGSARFDGNPSPHHHFVCTACGGIMDFSDPGLDALPSPEGARALGRIESSHFEFYGTCAACAAKESAAQAAAKPQS